MNGAVRMRERQPNLSHRAVVAGLAASSAVALPLGSTVAWAGPKPRELVANPGRANLLGKGLASTEIWGFDGQVPGPLIRIKQGEDVALRYRNALTLTSG